MKKQIIKRKKAFTLVELIIVITILSVLATIAFISFQNYTSWARDALRLSDIKSIYSWLQLYKIKSNKYPNPDNFTDIVWVSNQWYAWENIWKLIKINKIPKDPINSSLYTYVTSKDNNKIQLSTYLENNDLLKLSQINLLKQVYSDNWIDYTNKILYTYWDKIWIIIDNETKKPIQEIYWTWKLNIISENDKNKIFKVYFSNTKTEISSWETLLNKIQEEQNSCVLWNLVVKKWEIITAYNSSSVPFLSTCQSTQRKCLEWWILSWDNSYKYDICSPVKWDDCKNNSEYNWYNIPDFIHNESKVITKFINLWQSIMNVTCFNWKLTYWNETINCWEYVYDNELKTCNENLCKWIIPANSQLNWNQKYNTNWVYNSQEWDCHFICKDWYHFENDSCVINVYNISWNITNWGLATINICWKTTTTDSSWNFSVQANYNTNCNNLEIIKEHHSCSVNNNWPLNLLNDENNVSWNCIMTNFVFNKIISTDTTNYNIKLDAIWAGWDWNIPLIATITINNWIYVWASSTSNYAFDTWTWFPVWSSLKLINNWYIIWAWWEWWTAASYRTWYGSWQNGKNWWPALKAQYPLNITNNNIIWWWGGGWGWGDDRLRWQIWDGGWGGWWAGYIVWAGWSWANGWWHWKAWTYTSWWAWWGTTVNNVTGWVWWKWWNLGANWWSAANWWYASWWAWGKAVVWNSYITWTSNWTRYWSINN